MAPLTVPDHFSIGGVVSCSDEIDISRSILSLLHWWIIKSTFASCTRSWKNDDVNSLNCSFSDSAQETNLLLRFLSQSHLRQLFRGARRCRLWRHRRWWFPQLNWRRMAMFQWWWFCPTSEQQIIWLLGIWFRQMMVIICDHDVFQMELYVMHAVILCYKRLHLGWQVPAKNGIASPKKVFVPPPIWKRRKPSSFITFHHQPSGQWSFGNRPKGAGEIGSFKTYGRSTCHFGDSWTIRSCSCGVLFCSAPTMAGFHPGKEPGLEEPKTPRENNFLRKPWQLATCMCSTVGFGPSTSILWAQSQHQNQVGKEW